MGEKGNTCNNLFGISERKRLQHRRKDNIEMNLLEVKYVFNELLLLLIRNGGLLCRTRHAAWDSKM